MLRLIGTGFGRTGTDSMCKALNILGAGPTHHMFELETNLRLRQSWLDLVKGGEPDWKMLFAGYHACVDWPSAFYWRTLVDAHPSAKVLLTIRSAESWWNSFKATILKHILSSKDPDSFSQLLVADQVFEGRPDDKEHAIKIFKRNTEEVIATVDSERLLVHALGDGWGPLCRWLEVSIPEIDYPSGNTTHDFNQYISKEK